MRKFKSGLKRPFGSNVKRGHIYFIQQGDSGPIKIGFSTRPKERLRTLQTAHTDKLNMLHCELGSEADEARLHRKFSNIHIKGEWFKADDSLVEFIRKRKSL
jgi:hypothetical protein